uniref:Uncharacterized protein n=1 Tax=Solanum lycopersicum TaxID=4081 RepID=A0A3Q7GJ90_SOLLC
GTTSEEVIIKQ